MEDAKIVSSEIYYIFTLIFGHRTTSINRIRLAAHFSVFFFCRHTVRSFGIWCSVRVVALLRFGKHAFLSSSFPGYFSMRHFNFDQFFV